MVVFFSWFCYPSITAPQLPRLPVLAFFIASWHRHCSLAAPCTGKIFNLFTLIVLWCLSRFIMHFWGTFANFYYFGVIRNFPRKQQECPLKITGVAHESHLIIFTSILQNEQIMANLMMVPFTTVTTLYLTFSSSFYDFPSSDDSYLH